MALREEARIRLSKKTAGTGKEKEEQRGSAETDKEKAE
jgi:hypothetical protein